MCRKIYFGVLLQNLPVGTEENYGKFWKDRGHFVPELNGGIQNTRQGGQALNCDDRFVMLISSPGHDHGVYSILSDSLLSYVSLQYINLCPCNIKFLWYTGS
jgi:hypothetical protein